MLPLSEGGFEHLHERVIDIEMSYEKITVGIADYIQIVCKLWSWPFNFTLHLKKQMFQVELWQYCGQLLGYWLS